MSFEYRMVKCPRCGSSSALEYGSCQKCGQELKASNTANMFLLGAGGAVFIVALMSLLIFLTRDTALGGILALSVIGLSVLVAIIGNIWLIIAAFRVDVMWGMACFFIPLAQLVFLYKHTDRAIVPFMLSVFSLILLLIASFALP